MSQTDFEAAVTAEAEKLAAAAVEEQDGKLSSGAIAGIAVGSVAGIALLGFLIAKAFGNRNVEYMDEEFMVEEYGQAASCGCGG
tara:strand:+ start:53 stop:304 length:252 start_codon:yes stop_codon:yes gene_type:complete